LQIMQFHQIDVATLKILLWHGKSRFNYFFILRK